MVLTNLLKSLDGYQIIRKGEDFLLKKMENKQEPPRSWEEFCKRYPVKKGEAYMTANSDIYSASYNCKGRDSKSWCVSKEEAEAFLALMQLRQLRKTWVGDWEPKLGKYYSVISDTDKGLDVISSFDIGRSMSFPDTPMAEDFFDCFRDLLEKAKKLL